MAVEIKIACETKESAELDEFIEIQGELKDLSEDNYHKLKREILQTGFAFPLLVWHDTKARKKYILGGHQRARTLKRMRDEGAIVPKIPYVKVQAEDMKEAKRRVLQDVSQYGTVTSSGLDQFMKDASFNLSDITDNFQIPDMDMRMFQEDFYPNSNNDPLSSIDGLSSTNGKITPEEAKKTLSDRFMIAPFTVFNAREGWWQNRKRAWIALGIRSELGRGDATPPGGGQNLLPDSDQDNSQHGILKQASKGKNEQLQKSTKTIRSSTLGAVAPNQKAILKRTGKYAP